MAWPHWRPRRPRGYLRDRQRAASRRAVAATVAIPLAGTLAALGAVVAFAVAPPPVAAGVAVALLLLPLAAWIASRRAAGRAARFRAGARGEDALERALAAAFRDDYTLYRNLHLPGGGGDLDGVLLGPPGLILLENKAYRGEFVIFGDRWTRAAAPGSPDLHPWHGSPTAQAARDAARLAAWLAARDPTLAAVPIHPVVALSSGRVREQRRRPSVPVVPLADLGRHVRRLPRTRRLDRDQWAALAAALDRLNED